MSVAVRVLIELMPDSVLGGDRSVCARCRLVHGETPTVLSFPVSILATGKDM